MYRYIYIYIYIYISRGRAGQGRQAGPPVEYRRGNTSQIPEGVTHLALLVGLVWEAWVGNLEYRRGGVSQIP